MSRPFNFTVHSPQLHFDFKIWRLPTPSRTFGYGSLNGRRILVLNSSPRVKGVHVLGRPLWSSQTWTSFKSSDSSSNPILSWFFVVEQICLSLQCPDPSHPQQIRGPSVRSVPYLCGHVTRTVCRKEVLDHVGSRPGLGEDTVLLRTDITPGSPTCLESSKVKDERQVERDERQEGTISLIFFRPRWHEVSRRSVTSLLIVLVSTHTLRP